jgi:hypothetical protein
LTMFVGFSRLPRGFDLLESNTHAMDNPLTHELEISGAQVGLTIQAHHMILHHCGEHCRNFKHQLHIEFIRLGTLCHHQANKYL